jgi:DNA mismatch repair protein MutS
MAGVPHHQLEVYLRRLIQQGFRVAVCDQVQDPKDAKGIVDRAVTRVLTPGTLVEESLLDESAANRVAAVSAADLRDPTRVGVAIVEASTGAFAVLECDAAALPDELAPRGVQEVLYPEQSGGTIPPAIKRACEAVGAACTARPAWQFRPAEALEAVLGHYGVATVGGFGLADEDPCVAAAGAIIRYLRETQTPAAEDGAGSGSGQGKRRQTLAHLLPPRREAATGSCVLDAVSLRSLEVEKTIRAPGRAGDGSLVGLFLSSVGSCRTPMGKRLLREWLCRPLGDLEAIRARHGCVATMVEDRRTAKALGEAVSGVQDVARIAGRIALGRATPRDVAALGRSLARVDAVAQSLEGAPAFADHASRIRASAESIRSLAARINEQCVDAPPAHLREGGLFRDGVDAELDEARLLQRDAASWLTAYQQRLIQEHSLPGIKVGYNRVFGYYIELTASQARSAPAAFSRKQTLKNAERYITPELKEFEDKVTTAEARALDRERVLFERLCEVAAAAIPAISAFGQTVAELDALWCFAERAVRKGWVRPEMTDAAALSIRAARHPVLEEVLGEAFVPNDLAVGVISEEASESANGDGGAPALALITGPNMAGKSTFIRQVALIVLLAHAGSFVPAEAATIGVTDRIFTRVGADDALHAGQSTFMVEMTETATILNSATARSLVILDEIGRGTSTLDGLSLAWAIAEFLAGSAARPGPRTLFATHYHELTELDERLPGRVRNLHVAVREWGEEIVFLHRILPGRTDRSYGVHVAKLAGIPTSVVQRARLVLASLAVHHGPVSGPRPELAAPPAGQLSLFTEYLAHPVVDQLRELKLEAMAPIQAFDELRRLQQMVRGDDEPRSK